MRTTVPTDGGAVAGAVTDPAALRGPDAHEDGRAVDGVGIAARPDLPYIFRTGRFARQRLA